jgi:hypothetical protein
MRCHHTPSGLSGLSSRLQFTSRWATAPIRYSGQIGGSVVTIGHIAPSLLVAVPTRLRRRTVNSALHNRAWVTDIRGAPTVQVILGYLHVYDLLQGVQLQLDVQDRFVWRFSADVVYLASSAYKAIFIGSIKLWASGGQSSCGRPLPRQRSNSSSG